jgi:hypothetical protein
LAGCLVVAVVDSSNRVGLVENREMREQFDRIGGPNDALDLRGYLPQPITLLLCDCGKLEGSFFAHRCIDTLVTNDPPRPSCLDSTGARA